MAETPTIRAPADAGVPGVDAVRVAAARAPGAPAVHARLPRARAEGREVDADGRRSRCSTSCASTSPARMVICGATTGSQARIVFGHRAEDGRGVAVVAAAGRPGVRERDYYERRRAIKPVNAKASTQDGLNPSCIVPGREPRAEIRLARCAQIGPRRSGESAHAAARRRPATTCCRSATRCARR